MISYISRNANVRPSYMIQSCNDIRQISATKLLEFQIVLKKLQFTPLYKKSIKSSAFRSREGLQNVLSRIPLTNQPVIYKMSCNNRAQRLDLLNVYRSFYDVNRSRTLRVDRINMAKFNDTTSSVLYVGSTRSLKNSSFRERMNHHLGGGNIRTYSMQLSKWDGKIDYSIQIEAINIWVISDEQLNPQLVELIEQTYWDRHLPIFGKKTGL